MDPLLVITNSDAGTADDESLQTALGVLRAHTSVEVQATSDPGELNSALHRAGSRRIVVAGGDGSLHAVVTTLYRRTLRQIEQLTGRKIDLLHIVGGGSNNDLLNQFTANATGIAVLAGPAEATAAGNVILQALALGHIESLSAARKIIRDSSILRGFEPQETETWDRAFKKFEMLLSPAQTPDGAQLISTLG